VKRPLLREFIGYGAASALALAVDVGILIALVQKAHVNYLAAVVIAYLSGAVVAYFISTRYVFGIRRVQDPLAEFAAFTAIGLAGLAINAGVIYVLVSRLEQNYLVGKACAIALSFTVSFVLRKAALFSSASAQRRPPVSPPIQAIAEAD
jgi:putative flippase GtrA